MSDSRSSFSKAFQSSKTVSISPAPPSSTHSARKLPLTPSLTSSSNAPYCPSISEISPMSTAASVINIVGEVSKAVAGVPYVEAIGNIVNTLIKIREEVEANKKRCQELLDRVLKKIERIFNHLLTLKRCGGQGDLGQLEAEMRRYYEHNRPRYQRILNRGTDELERLNRIMNDFDSNLIMDIVMNVMENLRNQAQNSGDRERIQDNRISTHFPPAPIRILEREEQHNEIVAKLLSTADARVALLGMGGIGKTTLACSIARNPEIVQAYPYQLFLSFEGCSTSDLAYTNIATTFEVPPDQRASHRQILSHVLSHLRQQKTLFVIDNFETWWEVPGNRRDAEDFLGQLSCLQELALIVTLRGTQRPAGIDWLKIKPLPTLTQSGSMDLLSAVTKEDYTNDDLAYVQKLLIAVAGIPLAVTLIGALLRDESETPRSLWSQWTRATTQAISIDGDVDSDDHRLYKLDISLRLSIFGPRMSENAKQVLSAISILPTGLSMDDDDLDELQDLLPDKTRIRDCIRTLQNVALVTLDTSTSPNRLRMLPPVRDFCLNNLPLDGEVSCRLIDLYNANLLEHGDWGSSDDYAWVTTELSNVTAIVNHAIILCYITDDFGEFIYRYCTWKRYLCMPETEQVECAIAMLIEHPQAQARCLQSLGDMLSNFDRERESIQPLKQALAIHKELGIKDQEGWDLYLLGSAHDRLGDYSKAESYLREAKDLFIDIGDKRKQGSALEKLGGIYLDQDKLPQAECAAKEALELSRVSGSLNGELRALLTLGRVHRVQGEYNLAIEKLKASRDVSQAIHDTHSEALANEDLGHVYRDLDQLDEAVMHFQLAASLYGRVQHYEDVEDCRAALEELGIPLDTSE